jgi:hypothetical protein
MNGTNQNVETTFGALTQLFTMRLCAIVLKAVHIQIFESRLNPPEINTHQLTHAVVLLGPAYLFGYFVKLCQLERSTGLLKKLIVAQPVNN